MICAAFAVQIGSQALRGAVDCEVVRVDLGGNVQSGLELEADIEIRNKQRLSATYHGISGALTLSGQPVDFSLVGLSSGDRIAAGSRRTVSIVIQPEHLELLKIGVKSALSRSVRVRFRGVATVEVLGFDVELPIDMQHEVPLLSVAGEIDFASP